MIGGVDVGLAAAEVEWGWDKGWDETLRGRRYIGENRLGRWEKSTNGIRLIGITTIIN